MTCSGKWDELNSPPPPPPKNAQLLCSRGGYCLQKEAVCCFGGTSSKRSCVLLQREEWMPGRHPTYAPLYPHITQVSRGLKLNPKVMFTFSFERYAKSKPQKNRYFTLLTRLQVSRSWLHVHLLTETPDLWIRE